MNYERTLFRSDKVIKFAKSHGISFRLDRGSYEGQKFYKKHSLSKKKPALMVFDHHGDLLYKLQLCENPNNIVKEFKSAQTLTSKREAVSGKYARKIGSIKKLIKEKKYAEALRDIGRIKPPVLVLPLREKLKDQKRAVASVAKKKLRSARKLVKKKQYDLAITVYQDVAKTFGRIKSAKKKARAGVEKARKLKSRAASKEGKVSANVSGALLPVGAH